ncbi:MAG: hypothetical protein JWR15_906 [Prosthecobacter sp.]|nr:hypothetical protein [Prosthecobacter sp.]
MKTKTHLAWLVVSLVLAVLSQVQAKDEVRLSVPSKIEAAKRKDREKLFTPWMNVQALRANQAQMREKGQQILFFEYDSGRIEWRAIYSSTLKLRNPYSWWASIEESDFEARLNTELKLGRQPAFIVRDNGSFAMLFVSPDDMATVRKELTALGIGEPKLKK